MHKAMHKAMQKMNRFQGFEKRQIIVLGRD